MRTSRISRIACNTLHHQLLALAPFSLSAYARRPGRPNDWAPPPTNQEAVRCRLRSTNTLLCINVKKTTIQQQYIMVNILICLYFLFKKLLSLFFPARLR
jgi:hypothetical protein